MIGNGTVLVLSAGILKFFQGASLGKGPKTMAGWVAEEQRLRVPGVVRRGAGVLQVASLVDFSRIGVPIDQAAS